MLKHRMFSNFIALLREFYQSKVEPAKALVIADANPKVHEDQYPIAAKLKRDYQRGAR